MKTYIPVLVASLFIYLHASAKKFTIRLSGLPPAPVTICYETYANTPSGSDQYTQLNQDDELIVDIPKNGAIQLYGYVMSNPKRRSYLYTLHFDALRRNRGNHYDLPLRFYQEVDPSDAVGLPDYFSTLTDNYFHSNIPAVSQGSINRLLYGLGEYVISLGDNNSLPYQSIVVSDSDLVLLGSGHFVYDKFLSTKKGIAGGVQMPNLFSQLLSINLSGGVSDTEYFDLSVEAKNLRDEKLKVDDPYQLFNDQGTRAMNFKRNLYAQISNLADKSKIRCYYITGRRIADFIAVRKEAYTLKFDSANASVGVKNVLSLGVEGKFYADNSTTYADSLKHFVISYSAFDITSYLLADFQQYEVQNTQDAWQQQIQNYTDSLNDILDPIKQEFALLQRTDPAQFQNIDPSSITQIRMTCLALDSIPLEPLQRDSTGKELPNQEAIDAYNSSVPLANKYLAILKQNIGLCDYYIKQRLNASSAFTQLKYGGKLNQAGPPLSPKDVQTIPSWTIASVAHTTPFYVPSVK
ncbi:MAG TPA: hypothetical protein VGS79_04510 [Puia sp.]|nr:hypothetical protein [Puia sp.]